MKTAKDWEKRAERRLKRILACLPGRARQASVSIIGAPAMTRLNAKYRGKRKPTDVLSFPAPAVFARTGMLGDLILCLPVLKRQARELKHSPEIELDVLLVHGVTHLLGYDHERGAREEARQLRRERQLLAKLWGKASRQSLIGRTRG